MNTLTLITIVWLLFSAWRGYRQGLPKVLAGVLGFFLGYVACFMWGWPIAQMLAGWVPAVWQWPVAAMGLFLGVGLGLQLLAWPLVKRYRGHRTLAVIGAGINTLMAFMMLLGALWSVGLLAGVNTKAQVSAALKAIEFSPEHTLVRLSTRFVAQAVGVGLVVMGAEPAQVQATKTLVKAPTQSIQQLQHVAGSAQTKALLNSDILKHAVQSGNIDVLVNSPDFTAFTRQPSMGTMMALVPHSDAQSQEHAMANTLVLMGQKIETIKQAPEVKQALADPEVQALIQRGDNAALMAHPKMQPIFGEVMSALANDTSQPTYSTSTSTSTSTSSASAGVNNAVLYKWMDKYEAVHYSTWDKIPAAHREGAELINW